MPELPEVECQRRAVNRRLPRHPFAGLQGPSEVNVEGPASVLRRLEGRRLLPLGRRGKYLLLPFGTSKPAHQVLLLHLGMTGSVSVLAEGSEIPRHTRLVMRFGDARRLVLRDPRRFAVLVSGEEEKRKRLAKVGPEALEITPADFGRRLARRKAPVKAVLLDQSLLAGLGNIYAQEALFASRIGPLRRACDLTTDEVKRLLAAVKSVLNRAIKAMDGDGKGLRRRDFRRRVYGRSGEPCTRCGTRLVAGSIGGRTTVFCPDCQGVK